MGPGMGMGGSGGTINPFIQQSNSNPMGPMDMSGHGGNNNQNNNSDIFDMIREFAEK